MPSARSCSCCSHILLPATPGCRSSLLLVMPAAHAPLDAAWYSMQAVTRNTFGCPLQGMPISKQPGKKGDMIIHFDVKFPRTIPEDRRRQIAELLPNT